MNPFGSAFVFLKQKQVSKVEPIRPSTCSARVVVGRDVHLGRVWWADPKHEKSTIQPEIILGWANPNLCIGSCLGQGRGPRGGYEHGPFTEARNSPFTDMERHIFIWSFASNHGNHPLQFG
jgi:hypothetical protein